MSKCKCNEAKQYYQQLHVRDQFQNRPPAAAAASSRTEHRRTEDYCSTEYQGTDRLKTGGNRGTCYSRAEDAGERAMATSAMMGGGMTEKIRPAVI